jgi:surface polysaccharide O-acyltransferase-like enzyme
MDKFLSYKIRAISFWAILLVVFLHAYNLDTKQQGVILTLPKSYNWFVQNLISNGLTRIAVPLFFIISGYLFFIKFDQKSPNFSVKIRKRVKSLFVPYAIFSLLGVILYLILQSIPATQSFFTNQRIVDFDLLTLTKTIFITPIPYQLWFIRDLFVIVFFSPIWYILLKNLKWGLLIPIILLWLCDFESFNNSLEALLFFLIGSYIALYSKSTITFIGKQRTVYFLFLWAVFLLAKIGFLYFNASTILVTLLHKISILTGIRAVWNSYDYFSNDKQSNSSWYGITFFIYAFHEPVLTFFKKGLFFALGTSESQYFLVYFVAPILTIALSYLIGQILKKHFTFIYEIITGGR